MRILHGRGSRKRAGRRGRRNSYPHRLNHDIVYHGRKGRPVVHSTDTGKLFIMVRAPSGQGTKRLYDGSLYSPDKKPRTKKIRLVLN